MHVHVVLRIVAGSDGERLSGASAVIKRQRDLLEQRRTEGVVSATGRDLIQTQ